MTRLHDTADDPAEVKKRGRPALPPDQRQTARVEIRLTEAQRAKLERLGGAQWVRERIDKAKVAGGA